MIEHILKWLPSTTPILVQRWEKFIYLLKLNANRYRSRYINDQYISTDCTKFFERILINIPVDKFLTDSDDYSRFSNIDDSLTRQLSFFFDPIANSRNYCNTIVKSTNRIVPEYYLNVECSKPFTYLPMDKSWKHWERLKSVRLLYHDSRELVTDLLGMQVMFKKHQPTHLVVSIDLPAMIMQYVKYIEHHRQMGNHGADYRMFIKYHIIEPWHDDLIKIWLFNVLEDVVHRKFKLFKLFNSQGLIVSGKMKAAKSNIEAQFKMVKSNRIPVNKFMSAKWLGKLSLLNWLEIMDTTIVLPSFTQYQYLRFIM